MFLRLKLDLGVRFTPTAAGHVLGAAMFSIEIDGIRVLYTGKKPNVYKLNRSETSCSLITFISTRNIEFHRIV